MYENTCYTLGSVGSSTRNKPPRKAGEVFHGKFWQQKVPSLFKIEFCSAVMCAANSCLALLDIYLQDVTTRCQRQTDLRGTRLNNNMDVFVFDLFSSVDQDVMHISYSEATNNPQRRGEPSSGPEPSKSSPLFLKTLNF